MPLENWEIDGFKNYPYISHKFCAPVKAANTKADLWKLNLLIVSEKQKTKQKQMIKKKM